MEYDVAIIGGGPAGMMAAGRAGELGARVILLEKNPSLGVKLLVTGNGRCNLTNRKTNREFIGHLGKKGKFLFSALHGFGVDDLIRFFEDRGVATKIENDGKVFPASDKARDILDALARYLEKTDVTVRTGSAVAGLAKEGGRIAKLELEDGAGIIAKNYIIATGGRSYPQTGSTGDGYRWAEELGHRVVEPAPALTSMIIKEPFIKDLQGLSIENVAAVIRNRGKKIHSASGDIIFTANGISGPLVMDLTRMVAREDAGELSLAIDFFPGHDEEELDRMIRDDFGKDANKMVKNSLGFLPSRLVAAIAGQAGIDQSKKCNSITRGERTEIIRLLKSFCLSMHALSGFERAYITSGGVSLDEVEPSTMRSKLVANLFFAGEVLDLDGPTGGYNLQISWTTGYAAGSNAAS